MIGALPDRLLLVVDHDLLAQGLATMLGDDGVQVDRQRPLAATDVVATVRNRGHDLVLLDLDGWADRPDLRDLLGGLRDCGAPVVALTGTADSGELAVEQGARGVIRTDEGAGSVYQAVTAALHA